MSRALILFFCFCRWSRCFLRWPLLLRALLLLLLLSPFLLGLLRFLLLRPVLRLNEWWFLVWSLWRLRFPLSTSCYSGFRCIFLLWILCRPLSSLVGRTVSLLRRLPVLLHIARLLR